MSENNSTTAETKKLKPAQIIVFLIIFGGIVFGLYKCNKHSANDDIKEFATEQLSEQGYKVLSVSVLESKVATKQKKSRGTVEFIVLDEKRDTLFGKAKVDSKSSYLIFSKNVFEIESINKK
ncbi:MAG: hypothetical protein Q7V19_04880 [Bacteroidales bacterium]|nr:hypothetical protein [Bacteroidales bacterium]